jgi:hypothetical protein
MSGWKGRWGLALRQFCASVAPRWEVTLLPGRADDGDSEPGRGLTRDRECLEARRAKETAGGGRAWGGESGREKKGVERLLTAYGGGGGGAAGWGSESI